MSRDGRVLIGAQAVFNVGFYAIVPFLVVALREEHGQSAAAIGVILGARTFSQQGLFVVGGFLVDRWGSRVLIVVGCLLRAVGFSVLLLADHFLTLLLGAIVTGLAGALFSPAVEARLAREERPGGGSPFVWLMAVGEVGALVGPLVGVLLFSRGFDTSLLFGVALFAVTGLVLGVLLGGHDGQPAVDLEVARSGVRPSYLLFVALAADNLFAWNQLYFLVPLALHHDPAQTGVLFVLASALTVTLWRPVHHLVARLGAGPAIRLGFVLLVSAFVLPAAIGISPASVWTATALLALGHLILTPTHQRAALRLMADQRLRGVHLGLLATAGGLGVLLGNGVLGLCVDALGPRAPALWWGWPSCWPSPPGRYPAGWHPLRSSKEDDETNLEQRPHRDRRRRGVDPVGLRRDRPGITCGQSGPRRDAPATPLGPVAAVRRCLQTVTVVDGRDPGGSGRRQRAATEAGHRVGAPEHHHLGVHAAQGRRLPRRHPVRRGGGGPGVEPGGVRLARAAILNKVDLKAATEGDKLVITNGQPDPILPSRLSSPQLAILSAKAYEGSAVTPVGTGTGPFVLTKVDGAASATLERNEKYWGGRAKSAGIDVMFVPDGTARTAALRTGTADIVEAIPAGQVAAIDKGVLHEVAMPQTNALHLNSAKGPFQDAALRALARDAVDKRELVTTVYEGHADPGSGLLGPAVAWIDPARQRVGAAEIIARHSAPAAQGVSVKLATYSDRPELPEVAVLVQRMLKRKGFTVTLDVREYQYIEKDALAGAFDAFIGSRAMVLDSGDPVATLTSDYTCSGGFNLSRFCHPAADAAVAAAALVEPGTQRQEAIARAEATILALDPSVPLLHERVIQGEASGVVGAARDPRERELVGLDTVVKR